MNACDTSLLFFPLRLEFICSYDISSATQEQALGIEQVNKAIIEMDASTQQNTAMVEEAAAAAESMSEQSNELNRLVSFFQIGGLTNV